MPDREKVIKGLEACGTKANCNECPYLRNDCCEAALHNDVLELLRNQQWISVKDKRPDKQTPVIVYVPPYSDENEVYYGYIGMAYYTYSARGGYWAGTDGNLYGAIGIIHSPSHWMPRPEPPKELK